MKFGQVFFRILGSVKMKFGQVFFRILGSVKMKFGQVFFRILDSVKMKFRQVLVVQLYREEWKLILGNFMVLVKLQYNACVLKISQVK